MECLLALTTGDEQALAAIIVFLFGAVLAYGYGARCRAPEGCKKLFGEKDGDLRIRDTKVTRSEEWVMEPTRAITREEEYAGSEHIGQWRGQTVDQFHEKVRYEVEDIIEYWEYPCQCRFCGGTWTRDRPPVVNQRRKRIGPQS